MKKYLIAALAVIVVLLAVFKWDLLSAQEEELGYSYGTVISSISSDHQIKIIVREYDYEKEEEVDIAYTIDPKVELELEGVASLKDIAVGNSVEIDYIVRDGKNVAKVIFVEKSSQEEDYTPTETY